MKQSSTETTANSRVIKPHWFLRLFGVEPITLSLIDERLELTTVNGQRYVVLPASLTKTNTKIEGFLFADLRLITDRGELLINGLQKKACEEHFRWLTGIWFGQLSPAMQQVSADIEQLLSVGYPRTSRLKQVVELAQQAVKQFKKLPDKASLPNIDFTVFETLQFKAGWKEADFNLLRQQYIRKQLALHQRFFDEVESKPLTEKQREACVIDEDNNLVLAGAGTGKTSTMVGRAGYLLQSSQAQADEILMLAFANEAAAEMQERIEKRLGDSGITASTFHKLGKDIIASVEGKQPSLSPLAEDNKLLAKHVNDWFEAHLKQPAYQKLVLGYFQNYLYPVKNAFDFDSEGAYFDYILANDIRTLKGEKVKSLGECLIANYLLRQGVEYQYEASYEHPTADVFHRQYQPDFYLPDYGIYIEFYGIDRQGNTAPYVNRQAYHEGMAWKQQLHQKHGTKLVTLYHYQHLEGTLYTELDKQFANFGVKPEPLPPEAVLETLREFGAISVFAQLLSDLLKRYRANCYEPGQLDKAIDAADNPQQVQAALSLLLPVVDDYQRLLIRHNHIDFDDMIGKALGYVKSGRFKSRWKYLLVDEFQDISDARARLVIYLRDSVAGASLFCVGDDWQAIYRFTGSDLQFTTDFVSRFGPTKTTPLDLTFRFNNSISDVASRFVLQNPKQVRKQLNTLNRVSKPAVSLMRADNRSTAGEPDRLERVLQKISAIAEPDSTVYLLGRFGFNLPEYAELNRLSRQFNQLKLECHSIHASKGKEADYVVILGLENGKHGFPSHKQTHPLLEALLPASEPFADAEERRLFYVALTRARHRAYLITDMAVASEFVVELLNDNYPLELNEFDTSLSQQLFQLIKCIKCKTGSMVPRAGQFGAFFGCNKYPLCNHKERGCSKCSSPMKRDGRFKVCLNASCGNWVPVCPKCNAEMTQRSGPYSSFWGCRNYRKEGASCGHKEQMIEFKNQLAQVP